VQLVVKTLGGWLPASAHASNTQVVLVQALGLEEHADAFEREEVELDLVCSLSNADLLELGIADAGVARSVLLVMQSNHLQNVATSLECSIFINPCKGSRHIILAAAPQLAAPRRLISPADVVLPLQSVENKPRR
jgi:SAM domain (Sterile alpha motif)